MNPRVFKSNTPLHTDAQTSNQAWWEANPMTYDWEQSMQLEKYSAAWFAEIDRRFMQSAYYARGARGEPFGRFLRPNEIAGRAVLEVGCGMGTHAAMLARAGARLTAIDLTREAVHTTRRRFQVEHLAGTILQTDAERLPFADASFEGVWSWGVIHHSHSFETCLAEIARVLRPNGKLMLMVYYRDSIVYWLHCGLLRGVLMGQLRQKALDQIYVDSTDGFYARIFTRRELENLIGNAFDAARFHIVGLVPELYPIPRSTFKRRLETLTPTWAANAILSRWGSMIVIEASRRG